MQWTDLKISVKTEDVDIASDIANMAVPYGIYIEDYSNLEENVEEIAHIDLIDEELLKKDRSHAIIHIFINPEDSPAEAVAFLRERYGQCGIEFTIDTDFCNEEDWLNNWKKYFIPLEVGEKLLIRPTWRDKFDPKNRLVIDIDPGLAFGTGGHETTKLCLSVLEKHIKGGETLLDVGTGSGILAIASVKLGAKCAFGVDIDETAVKVANENATLNKVDDKFTAVVGDLTDKVTGTFDVVVANIVANAIMMLSKSIKNFMNENSIYIMSGIIDTRADEVINSLSDDFNIIETHTDKGWYCLVATLK